VAHQLAANERHLCDGLTDLLQQISALRLCLHLCSLVWIRQNKESQAFPKSVAARAGCEDRTARKPFCDSSLWLFRKRKRDTVSELHPTNAHTRVRRSKGTTQRVTMKKQTILHTTFPCGLVRRKSRVWKLTRVFALLIRTIDYSIRFRCATSKREMEKEVTSQIPVNWTIRAPDQSKRKLLRGSDDDDESSGVFTQLSSRGFVTRIICNRFEGRRRSTSGI